LFDLFLYLQAMMGFACHVLRLEAMEYSALYLCSVVLVCCVVLFMSCVCLFDLFFFLQAMMGFACHVLRLEAVDYYALYHTPSLGPQNGQQSQATPVLLQSYAPEG